MEKAAFYLCHQCQKPFFGGQVDCERDLNLADTIKKEDLKCKACQIKKIGGGVFNCPKHGHKHITWKCHLCCTEALYRCGNAYFCEAHHDQKKPKEAEKCLKENCPLGIEHPPNSNNPIEGNYPLGCSICRQEKKNYLGDQNNFMIEEEKLDADSRIIDKTKNLINL